MVFETSEIKAPVLGLFRQELYIAEDGVEMIEDCKCTFPGRDKDGVPFFLFVKADETIFLWEPGWQKATSHFTRRQAKVMALKRMTTTRISSKKRTWTLRTSTLMTTAVKKKEEEGSDDPEEKEDDKEEATLKKKFQTIMDLDKTWNSSVLIEHSCNNSIRRSRGVYISVGGAKSLQNGECVNDDIANWNVGNIKKHLEHLGNVVYAP